MELFTLQMSSLLVGENVYFNCCSDQLLDSWLSVLLGSACEELQDAHKYGFEHKKEAGEVRRGKSFTGTSACLSLWPLR